MTVIYLALGSNVGDKKENINHAVRLLGEKVTNIKLAPLYTTKPVGYKDQANFLNTALSGETDLQSLELLKFVKNIEIVVGRIKRFRNGPREIDIDIIFYDDKVIESPGLTIPHPRFRDRDFVLKPLCDLSSSFIDPVSGQTIEALLNNIPLTNIETTN